MASWRANSTEDDPTDAAEWDEQGPDGFCIHGTDQIILPICYGKFYGPLRGGETHSEWACKKCIAGDCRYLGAFAAAVGKRTLGAKN